jgi:microcin C transport system substrate-binding protein
VACSWVAAGALANGLPVRNAVADDIENPCISAFGDLKYPADLHAFRIRQSGGAERRNVLADRPARMFNQNFLTFNSLNSFILKGDGAQGMQFTFATLMAPALTLGFSNDEPDSMYGLAARAVRISADKLTYRYLLRPEARFHDGTRLTAHDVAFSLKLLKEKGHPIIRSSRATFSARSARTTRPWC